MVRFKNRYLLIQLLPFHLKESDNQAFNSKKRRYIDSEVGSVNVCDETDSTIPASYTVPDSPSTTTTTTNTKLSFDPASVIGMLRHELEVNFGLQGSAALSQSLTVKYTNTATGMVILRCARDHVQRLLSTVTWCSNFPQGVEGVKCTWRVVHCAGTIKSCQQAAIAFAKREGKLTPELSKKLSQLDG